MRLFFLLVLIFIFPGIFLAQDTESVGENRIINPVLIIKLKPEFRNLANANGFNANEYVLVSADLRITSCSRMFPSHNPPENNTNRNLVDLSLLYKITYSSEIDPATACFMLKKIGIFEYVEPRPKNSFLSSTNDPKVSLQYYLKKINAFQAWDIESGDSNVVVGITDSGTDFSHEDLQKNVHRNYNDTIDGIDNDNDGYIDNFFGWDFGSNDYEPQWYPLGHGVFVTGIIGATQNNNKGMAGVGGQIQFLPIKIDDTTGYLAYDYEGVVYAADHGCSIINCSWGGNMGGAFGQEIVNYATFNRNALVIAAAGNSDNSRLIYPASYKNVLSCAATDSLDQKAGFSSFGKMVDISAPGANVLSTFINNSYISSNGTSFSAPCVSAAAALVKSRFPDFNALEIAEQLKVTSDFIDTVAANSQFTDQLGFGRLNIYRALTDTFRPSISLESFHFIKQNDTLQIFGAFKNILHASSVACFAKIISENPNFTAINDTFSIGVLAKGDTISNFNFPYTFVSNSALVDGLQYDFKIVFTDTNYRGYEYFSVHFTDDCIQLDTNETDVTVCSNGNLGFKNAKMEQGKGFLYGSNTKSLLSCAGLVLGNSDNRVSDNVYLQTDWSNAFRPLNIAHFVNPPLFGNQQIQCIFNDDSAGFTKMGLTITQNSYAFNNANLNKAGFHQYKIKNSGLTSLNTFYAGLYVDWDIMRSGHNRADYDSILQLSYTWCTDGGSYAGIMLLKGDSVRPYNLNNDGSDNSVKITDGFINFEKYQCLKSSRIKAGQSSFGADVSSLLSSGPYSLFPGDSIEVEYALITGDNLADIKQVAQNVRNYYFNYNAILSSKSDLDDFHIFPNPVNHECILEIEIHNEKSIEIVVYNSQMQEIISEIKQINSNGKIMETINLADTKAGVYLVKLKAGDRIYLRKIVKLN